MKVKFGALMVDGRGKAGGSVFSKNKSGSYMKNKVTPTNPNSPAQQLQRSLLAQFSQQWRTLPQDVQQGFKDGAQNFQLTNIFGDRYTLSGNALFNRLNANLSKIGQAPISVCPAPKGVENETIVSFVADPAFIELSLSNVVSVNTNAVVRLTPCFSAGISNFKNKLRDTLVITNADGPIIQLLAAYTNHFGAPTTGQKIGVSLQCVNILTGEHGVPTFAESIVV